MYGCQDQLGVELMLKLVCAKGRNLVSLVLTRLAFWGCHTGSETDMDALEQYFASLTSLLDDVAVGDQWCAQNMFHDQHKSLHPHQVAQSI